MRGSRPFVPEMPPAHWDAISEFVTTVTTAASGRTPYSDRELLGVITRHAHWCWQVAGIELVVAEVLDARLVEMFIRRGCPERWSAAARGNARSMLLRVSEVVLGSGIRRTPLPSANPARPYSDVELERLRSWASAQRTPARRRDCGVLLGLGAGGGLATEDFLPLLARDVRRVTDGITVHVAGRRARSVPIVRTWEYMVEPSIDATDPDRLIFRPERTRQHRNAVSTFITKCSTPPVPVTTQRLRATWLVNHLARRTPIVVLMEAAGLETISGLSRYLPFVPTVDPASADRLLRGDNQR